MKAIFATLVGAYLWLVAGIARLLRGRPKRVTWRFERVEDLPDRPEMGFIYLAGAPGHLWGASMLCPCGCRETIDLNLLTQVRPHWKVSENANGTATLSPSVWRQMGCKSHFIVRRGQIVWC
jgi:hypothetical protein